MNKIGLSEMVLALRQELLTAQREGEAKDLKFKVEDIDLEVEVMTTKEGSGKGSIKFWVCDAEANASFSQAKTHRLTLRLKPLGKNGDVKISDRDRK
jgi:hypothetical protein